MTRSSRFLFVDPGLESLVDGQSHMVGGASVQAWNWMRGLVACGHQVGMLSRKPVTTPERVTVYPGHPGGGGWRGMAAQRRHLRTVLRDFRPDFVYQGAAGVVTYMLADLVPRESALFVHRTANNADFDANRVGRHRLGTRLLYPRALRRAGAVICQNAFQEERVSEIAPRSSRLVVGNPVWLSQQAPLPRRSRTYVAWLGRFVYQKGLPLLDRIAGLRPEVEFRVAGSRPNSSRLIDPKTEEALSSLERRSNVVFTGFLSRTDVPEFLAGAGCLLCTSRFEGFPNTFLEAWSAGTPVVTTEASDPDGVVARYRLGRAASTADDLARGIDDSFDDEAVGASVRTHVEQHHSATVLARRVTEWLQELPAR